VPFFGNVGPKVTLAEQWNGNGPATGAADDNLAARRTAPNPCARASRVVSARAVSTWFTPRPSIQTARARLRELKAFQWCRGM
jgi:hypothetical protein